MTEKVRLSHWLEYLPLRVLMALLFWLPFDWASALGGGLGRLVAGCHLSPWRRAIKNLEKVFPQKTEQERATLASATLENFGRTLFEFPQVYAMSASSFARRVRVEGVERLMAHPDALVLTAHLGNWDIICRMLGLSVPNAANVYRAANNPLVNAYMVKTRERAGVAQFPKGARGARSILKHLKSGGGLGMLLDQKMNDGIPAPFLGFEVMTAPALAELALRFNRPVLPVFCVREGACRFTVRVGRPLKLPEGKATAAKIAKATALFNEVIGQAVLAHPGQWLWMHKRFS